MTPIRLMDDPYPWMDISYPWMTPIRLPLEAPLIQITQSVGVCHAWRALEQWIRRVEQTIRVRLPYTPVTLANAIYYI